MILITSSVKDCASLNIKQKILEHYPFLKTAEAFHLNAIYKAEINGKSVKMITLDEESVRAQNLPESFPDAELIVFISRHSSASGKPTLSVHTPGNFAEAGLGGLPRTLSMAPAASMQTALRMLYRLNKEMSLNYEVSYECTHHGPSLSVPTMFVELGSSQAQWSDLKAAEAVAHAAMSAVANFEKTAEPVAIGIGGTHYNEKFTRMALEGDTAFGHMIPKYAMHAVDSEMLSQCVQKTLEKVSLSVLDWKGIAGHDKPRILSSLQELGLTLKKV